MNAYPIGTMLSRPKDGLVLHWGVITGPDLIFHNTPERGEHESSISAFAGGKRVTIRGRVQDLGAFGRRVSLKKANPLPYHFLNNNCEHTLNALVGRPKASPQVAGWVGLAAAAVVFALILND
jgi:hypothetical protein